MVQVLASTAMWNVQTADPSSELAPYTGERLRMVTAADFSPRPKLLAPLRVQRVEKAEDGGYNVIATWRAEPHTPSAHSSQCTHTHTHTHCPQLPVHTPCTAHH